VRVSTRLQMPIRLSYTRFMTESTWNSSISPLPEER